MRSDYEKIFADFLRENDIDVRLSHDMPAGYERAYGTYDVVDNTLYLNTEMLKDAPDYEVLFYLYHELRHAVQYLHPELFNGQIQASRFYVVLYNGTCFRLAGGAWLECRPEMSEASEASEVSEASETPEAVDGTEDYFLRAYLSLPYEIDANAFAYRRVKDMCGDSPELCSLYGLWTPLERLEYGEFRRLFGRIDALTGASEN